MSEKHIKETGKAWMDYLLAWIPVVLAPVTILGFWYFQIEKYYICSVLLMMYVMIPFFVIFMLYYHYGKFREI